MLNNSFRFFILTGDPGVGKTTLIKKLSSIINDKGVKTVGFYTEEVRKNNVREGFDVISLDGPRGRLARDQSLLTGPSRFKVGKYGVMVQEFEIVALPSLKMSEGSQCQLLVIDEIGKMEFFSEPFKNKIREIFGPSSNSVVLATIPVRKSYPLIETIRNNTQTRLWMVTRENRNTIHNEILEQIQNVLGCSRLSL